MNRMIAAVLTESGFEIQEVAAPITGPDEILVKTIACGVCSGDVFVYQNRSQLATTSKRLGHEASGEVVATGRNVTAFRIGDVVTAIAESAYAAYFTVPAAMAVKLPPEIEPKHALGEAVACCVHAANRFGINPGDRVAIVGCGFMGLLCLQLAKTQKAGFICAIDPVDERQDMARLFGADVSYHPLEENLGAILERGFEFDVVIEAAGTQNAIDLCTELVCQHGRLVLVGYHQSNNGLRTVNMEQWNYKAIDVINGHVRRMEEKAEAMRQGVALMQNGHLSTKPLVDSFAFQDIERVFRELTEGKPGRVKAVLLMDP